MTTYKERGKILHQDWKPLHCLGLSVGANSCPKRMAWNNYVGEGELTAREFMWRAAGDNGESKGKLEFEEGGRDCSTFMGFSSENSETDVGVDTAPWCSDRDDDEELFRVCVLRCRVIMSLLHAEYGHWGHLYGFSPVWVRWWVLKWSDLQVNGII